MLEARPMSKKTFITIAIMAAFMGFEGELHCARAMDSVSEPYVVRNTDIPPSDIIATEDLLIKPHIEPNIVWTIDESKKVYGISWSDVQGFWKDDKNVIDYAQNKNIDFEKIDNTTIVNLMKINADKKSENALKWYFEAAQSDRDTVLKEADKHIVYQALHSTDNNDAFVAWTKPEILRSTNLDVSEYLIVRGDGPGAIRTYAQSMGKIIESGNSDPAWTFKVSDAEKKMRMKFDMMSNTYRNSKIGEVSFGRPFAFTAREKKLSVPPSIERKMEVYWVEFAITPRIQSGNEISSLNFSVDMILDESIALELVPLEYGKKINEKQESGSPEITVEVGGGKLTVGEFFKRTVEYEYIKPTVKALGLREQQFGWLLEKEMATTGAKRFICILGVPKHTKKLEIRQAVTAERRNYFGRVVTEVGTTDPVNYTIDLP